MLLLPDRDTRCKDFQKPQYPKCWFSHPSVSEAEMLDLEWRSSCCNFTYTRRTTVHHTRNVTGSHLRTTWIGPYLAQNYTCVLPLRLALGYGYTYLSYYSSPLAKYFDIAIFASAIRPWNVNLATKAYSKKVRNGSTICSARSLSAQRASRVVGSVINKVDHVSFSGSVKRRH